MKKLFTLSVIALMMLSLLAQTPQKLSYQAVVRNSSGGLVTSHTVGMKISILQGSESGTAVYVETHTLTTNSNGLATIDIGGGSVVSGNFSTIPWGSGSYFLKTETDPTGGASYSITGTSQLLSVPYALFSEASGELTLPFTGAVSSALPAIQITNSGTGEGIKSVAVSVGNTGIVGEAPNQGIFGHATSSSGAAYGVQGTSASETGSGVTGVASSTTGQNYGIRGLSLSSTGTGVFGNGRYALRGETSYETGYGINLRCTHPTGVTRGINVEITSPNGFSGYFAGGKKFYIGSDVGIGTLFPGYKLDVAGPANLNNGKTGVALRCEGDEALWYNGTYFSWGYGGSWNFFGDKVFIGSVATDPGTNLLVVNGAAAKPGGGSWATWSDSRLKDILGFYSRGLNEILKLNPIMFSYKDGNKINLPDNVKYAGLIAQEVREVFPEAVSEGSGGYLQLDIHPVNMALINAVKELKAENDRLKSENEEILSRLEKLEAKIGK